MSPGLVRLFVFSLSIGWCTHGYAVMVHQYTFNDGTVSDSIGTADGTLIGTASIGGLGRLDLAGGGAGSSYADLPNGIASAAAASGTSGAFSFEVWAQANANTDWAALVSFGGAAGEEDDTGTGATKDYIQLIPQNGANQLMRATTHAANVTEEGFVDHSAPLSTIIDQHMVVVVDQSGGTPGTISLFVDGALVDSTPVADGLNVSTMTDNNNWLGRSQWNDASFNGSYDEFRIYDHALTPGEVDASFVAGPVPPPAVPLTPTLFVDREDGSMTLQGGQTASQVVGYSIQSAQGALEQANWTPIADRLDANPPGNGSFDNDGEWAILTADGSNTDFSEFEFDGGDGGTLGVGDFLNLSDPGGWIQSPIEDLVMDLKLDDGSTVSVDVVFTGNGDVPFARSDLNFDGEIDELDWPRFRDNHRTDLSNLSVAQAYSSGDIDGDGDNDYDDLLLFQQDFDAANGLGAFTALMTSTVPEPGTLLLLASVVVTWLAASGGSRNLSGSQRKT